MGVWGKGKTPFFKRGFPLPPQRLLLFSGACMKFLAVDYGQKRTGIAVTDAGGRMAFPRATLAMRGREAFVNELLALAEAEGAEALVIGLPVRGDGTDSETTRQVRNMVALLKERTALPVYLMEETLSSYEAETHLRATGKSGKGIMKKLDQAAAVAILESFLALPEQGRTPA